LELTFQAICSFSQLEEWDAFLKVLFSMVGALTILKNNAVPGDR
jgi:hypothetical protein